MAILRFFRGSTILENNIVQTIASAAGTLAAIIFVLPGLIMVGWWPASLLDHRRGVRAGGILGVMFSVPLRRALVTGSDLPYPEGVAAAEVLKVGSGSAKGCREMQRGLRVLVLGSVVLGRLRLARQDEAGRRRSGQEFRVGGSATGCLDQLVDALIGVGHLVGCRSARRCSSA
jgi:putative OPT family oligopeptide transporter